MHMLPLTVGLMPTREYTTQTMARVCLWHRAGGRQSTGKILQTSLMTLTADHVVYRTAARQCRLFRLVLDAKGLNRTARGLPLSSQASRVTKSG